ncbi:hypothetical protein CCU68_19060 [Pseudomonas gingeri NCPPB 3146 = LMG 5327]|uniref:DUF1534 domain-containing protein n=1 Tax=Pseudomonas gingeri NCPPB 3146 = LMG 5327 TaxID=707248 RepID=A0ABX4Y0Y7_9PSED|nr:hypothetical protein CCU68_19060 [Pseudomonas gingeri NCPPB 3146 = LMG 5327]
MVVLFLEDGIRLIVPTRSKGIPLWTLRVRSCDAERHGLHALAARGDHRVSAPPAFSAAPGSTGRSARRSRRAFRR